VNEGLVVSVESAQRMLLLHLYSVLLELANHIVLDLRDAARKLPVTLKRLIEKHSKTAQRNGFTEFDQTMHLYPAAVAVLFVAHQCRGT
jgi:hypothetical protein